MKIEIPELSLVLLIGATSSGKSSFARRHFLPTEVVSSDFCRGLLADDENDQSVTADAFDVLHTIVAKRLKLGRLAVVDATSVTPAARKTLIQLAREHDVFCNAIVFDLPERVLVERHATRSDRDFPAHVIRNQCNNLHRNMRGLEREGCRNVHVLRSVEDVDAVEIVRARLWTNRRDEHGPFDIIGDVHGCYDELISLLGDLGYVVGGTREAPTLSHPAGRRVIFIGDLVDRGPDTPAVLRLAQAAVAAGSALCVAGNHDNKLALALRGRNVQRKHGIEVSLDQLANESEAFRTEAARFLYDLRSHYVLDDGRLVVAHAGLIEAYQGRSSGRVRQFAMYGETTGETDEYGLPVRYNWARDYRGSAMVVYGHTPVPEPDWLNNTICLDTGCVFGGKLTALRYPEREIINVPAAREYYAPSRPIAPATPALSAQQVADDMLDFADVSGRRYVRTTLGGTVAIREENAAAALEVMSRFAVDPKWLIYLPPTMSPPATSRRADLLEHPDEAFAYYREQEVAQVVCEQKHMGSRAVFIVCRQPDVARRRFGIDAESMGVIYTRTGRAFFTQPQHEQALLGEMAAAMEASGLWEELASDWVCLDCELLPWSAKAQALIQNQYAHVGAAAEAMLGTLGQLLAQSEANGRPQAELATAAQTRLDATHAYRKAYAGYCWDTEGLTGIRVAPFHLLASEGQLHTGQNHLWHMRQLARLAQAAPERIIATPHRTVDLADPASCIEATEWWTALTASGGEGMVVKPLDFLVRGKKGLLQPAVKCRGPEYLRIIYGPEYLLPQNLDRLRARRLGAKRALALREFALGLESLQRFLDHAPLRQIHECAFGVLALESEPIDPRL